MICSRAAKYLWDAHRAAEWIVNFTAGRSYNEYLTDKMLSSAVERQFEIIGEALIRLRRTEPETAAMVPDVSDIIGFRNVLVHDYDGIDVQEVWATIQRDVPKLLSALADLLRRAPPLE